MPQFSSTAFGLTPDRMSIKRVSHCPCKALNYNRYDFSFISWPLASAIHAYMEGSIHQLGSNCSKYTSQLYWYQLVLRLFNTTLSSGKNSWAVSNIKTFSPLKSTLPLSAEKFLAETVDKRGANFSGSSSSVPINFLSFLL